MYSSSAEPVLRWQSRGSPSAAPSWYTKPCLEKRSSTFCPSPRSWDGCLWFGLEIRGPFRSAIGTGAATAPIGTTTTSPGQTREQELGTGAPCTLWIPGRSAGPATREDQWTWKHSVCHLLIHYCIIIHHYYFVIMYYYKFIITYYYKLIITSLWRIITSLLRIITSLLHHYYIIITSLLHHYYMWYFSLLHCYYIVITSFLRIIAIPLLHIITIPLLRIITTLLRIITSLLRHYYVIMQSAKFM